MTGAREELERLLGPEGVTALDVAVLPSDLPLAIPGTEEELLEVLRLAAARRWCVVPVGLGSKLSWCAPPERVDLALSTRRLAGVVAHEPGDGTLTARAGSTMESLEHVAREGGNRVTPMVPLPSGATLGGVLAAGQSGIDRARCGPARHHVLGMRVALADASTAKSGGRLVKNVTGYDLHRLYCGSHGTLCVILEASLRLFPRFESAVRISADAANRTAALALAGRIEALGVDPLCVRAENVSDPGGRWRVHVLLAGRAPVIEWASGVVRAELHGAHASDDGLDEIRDLELRTGAWPGIHVACLPSRVPDALALLPDRARAIVDPSIAIVDAHVEGGELAKIVASLRAAGLQVAVRGAPDGRETGGGVDPFGEPDPALPMMRRLKRALDPDGLFAAGRFHARI